MKRETRWLTFFVLVTLLVSVHGGVPRAEVSATDGTIGFIVLGITEGPDPVLASLWGSVRPEAEETLNAGGDSRIDGRPDIHLDLQNNQTTVVWSYNVGSDYDVAFSTWDGENWLVKEYLTTSLQDDLDPRLSIDAEGTFWVVWWEQATTPRIYLTSRAQDEPDWAPRELIADDGMKPSVLMAQGLRFVAFERLIPTGGKDIVIQMSNQEGDKTLSVAAHTDRSAPLDVVLHDSHGRIWMEWKHSSNQMAYSEFVGGNWVAPETTPWDDEGWVADESARRRIRVEVVSD